MSRSLEALRVKSRFLDRHAKKHRRALSGSLIVPGGGCSISGTGVLGFDSQGHVNLEDLHITIA